jgi:branched-chain amino acid transport system permease protein
VALGFTIVFSSTQVVNFAQGEFVMLGAMGSYWLTSAHWPLYAAVPGATLLAVAVGMALGWVLMRPLQHASTSGLIIITVGASMLLQGLASHFWGKDAVPVDAFSSGDPLTFTLPHFLSGSASPATLICETQKLWVMGLAAAMMIVLTFFFNRTMVGKAMRAVSVNRHGARLIGVNVSHMVIGAFALSAAMGAVAGAAIAPISCGYYNMGTMMGLKGFAAAIVGGLGNFPGSIMAGLFLGVLETFGARYLSSDYKDAFAFIILLAVLFINPQGLFAFRRRKANG